MSITPNDEEKLAKLVRLLSSSSDGEVIAAARAIQRTLSGAGSDVHELAERVSGGKLSETEMRKIYDAAYEAGKNDAAVDQGFTEAAGPSWHQMATFCAERGDRWLTAREREFVDDMVSWTARRDPSEKQGKWLHVLYVRLARLGRR